MRRLVLLISALSIFAVPATASAADNGGLRQLPGVKGCLTDEASTPSGCEDVRAMTDVGQMALSPDGSQLYVPSKGSDAVLVFNRNPATGALTQEDGVGGCLTSDAGVAAANECAGPPGIPAGALNGVSSVAVSPDGKNVYAAVPLNS